jgi:hypothetical protein
MAAGQKSLPSPFLDDSVGHAYYWQSLDRRTSQFDLLGPAWMFEFLEYHKSTSSPKKHGGSTESDLGLETFTSCFWTWIGFAAAIFKVCVIEDALRSLIKLGLTKKRTPFNYRCNSIAMRYANPARKYIEMLTRPNYPGALHLRGKLIHYLSHLEPRSSSVIPFSL